MPELGEIRSVKKHQFDDKGNLKKSCWAQNVRKDIQRPIDDGPQCRLRVLKEHTMTSS